MAIAKLPLIAFGYAFGNHFVVGSSYNTHFGFFHSSFFNLELKYSIYGNYLVALYCMGHGISIYNYVMPE